MLQRTPNLTENQRYFSNSNHLALCRKYYNI